MLKLAIILLIIFAGATISAEAQYGFGTNVPDPQAAIDLNVDNKGMLIPRVSLVALNNFAPFTSEPANSMLVWNKGDGGLDVIGFYYWDAVAQLWVKLIVNDDIPAIVPGTLSSPQTLIFTIDGVDAVLKNATIELQKKAAGSIIYGTGTDTDPVFGPMTGDIAIDALGVTTIQAGSVTSEKIATKAVTTDKIMGGAEFTVLKSTADNATIWDLITNDNISANAGILVNKLAGGVSNTGKTLTVDESGNPVWTPGMKWFYMPGYPIPTSTAGTFTLDLYNDVYRAQFIDIPANQNSTGAVSSIQTLPNSTDLIYYVIGHDANVFTINSISSSGVLNYTVGSNPATDCSFITIVFVIK